MYQNFVSYTPSDFFHGQTNWGRIYWSEHSKETRLPKQDEDEVEEEEGEEHYGMAERSHTAGSTKWGILTVPLTSCLTGLD